MMYIIRRVVVTPTQFTRQEKLVEYAWHVGERKPLFPNLKNFNDVCEIQADCDELAFIRNSFTNIPDNPLTSSMRWNGEWAQFIYDNLGRK